MVDLCETIRLRNYVPMSLRLVPSSANIFAYLPFTWPGAAQLDVGSMTSPSSTGAKHTMLVF